MERARQLKEERKSGGLSSASGTGSVFKNAAQDSVHRRKNSVNGRSQQLTQMSGTNGIDSTATSMLSSPSIHGDRINIPPYNGQGMPNQMGYQNGYGQSNNSAMVNRPGMGPPNAPQSYHQSYYQADRGGMGQDAFSVPLTDDRDMAPGMQMGQPQQYFSPPMGGNMYPTQNFGGPPRNDMMRNSNQDFRGDGVIINNRTQDHYFSHQQQQQMHMQRSSMQIQNQNGFQTGMGYMNPGPMQQQMVGGSERVMNNQ